MESLVREYLPPSLSAEIDRDKFLATVKREERHAKRSAGGIFADLEFVHGLRDPERALVLINQLKVSLESLRALRSYPRYQLWY